MIGKRRSKPKSKPVLGSTTPVVSMESDWACLPEDLFVLILDRLVTLLDYVRLSAVCMPWHAIALEKYDVERRLNLSMPLLPLLFLTHSTTTPSEEARIGIYSVSQNKTYNLKSFVPSSGCQRWCGSSHGWLISVDENHVITLSNPFCSNEIIRFPPFSHGNCYRSLVKVILSADPILLAPDDDYTVMAICSHDYYDYLYFIKPGNKAWTWIKGIWNVTDVIYSKGLFYALNEFGSVQTCDISEHCTKFYNTVSATLSPDLLRCPKFNSVLPKYCTLNSASTRMKNYIVELAGGDLLQLLRFVVEAVFYYDYYPEQQIKSVLTVGFKVFKLLVVNGEQKWIETKNLGDGTLFMGDNTLTYVSASDFLRCQPNSIYFTDYFAPHANFAPYDMSIFNLGDRSFQRDCVSKLLSSKKNIKKFLSYPVSMSPPCWIEPNFQGKKA